MATIEISMPVPEQAHVPPQPDRQPLQPDTAQRTTAARHQSAEPEVRLSAGDWFDFVKAFLARLFHFVGIDWWVSVRKLKLLDTQLFDLGMRCQRIVTIVNSKGGSGKTPLATFLAAIFQVAFGDVVIIDANENDGNTAKRLGITRNRSRILLRDAIDNPVKIATLSTLKMMLGIHQETKLLCLPSDPSSPAGSFTKTQFTQLGSAVFQDCHSLVYDTGNGNGHVANRGAVQMADVLLVSILADNTDSYDAAITTLEAYYQLGYQELVRESLLVFSATRWRHSKERLLVSLRKAVLKRVAGDIDQCDVLMKQLGITEDNIHMIPYSSFIKKHNTIVTLNPRDIGIRTLFAMYQLAITIFKRQVVSPEEKAQRDAKANATQRSLDTAPYEQLGLVVNPA